jgi:hypothetical protein
MRRFTVLWALCLVLLVPALSTAAEQRTFGTPKTFLALTPWDFRPLDSTINFQINSGTAIGETMSASLPNESGVFLFIAPLHLPAGALVTEIEAVFCDNTGEAAFSSTLVIQPRMAPSTGVAGPNSGVPELAPGCVDQTTVLDPPVVIDNDANSYRMAIALPFPFPTLQFGSMRVGYVLQVSSAPATATFNDVPTNHPFFPFIEALVRSGITVGCGDGSDYCPDDPLTRGQMAVFLSKALGLHFAP